MKKKPPQLLFPKREFTLTDREKDVLKLFVRGKTYVAISEKLEISIKKVGSYLRRVREKIRSKDRDDLIALAIKEKLISPKARSLTQLRPARQPVKRVKRSAKAAK